MKRNESDKIIAGVCSGLAKELGTTAIIVRLTFLLAFLCYGFGPLLYIILWILMPVGE